MNISNIKFCIEKIEMRGYKVAVSNANAELAAMQARIESLELERIGTNRLLQEIASELGCEPNSDILAAILSRRLNRAEVSAG